MAEFNGDDIPTTSKRLAWRHSPKKKSPHSPLQAGSVGKFKKFRDDQARKLLKRSRLLMQDKHKPYNGTRNRSNLSCSSYLKTNIRKRVATPQRNPNRNNKKRKIEQLDYLGSDNFTPTSDHKTNSMGAVLRVDTKNDSDSDDDCVIVEQFPSHVTILDVDDNDDDDSSSDNSDDNEESVVPPTNSSYQLFSESFSRRLSSTPCGKNTKPDTNQNVVYANQYNAPLFAEVAKNQFFVDVATNAYLGKIQYKTLAPLTGVNREPKDKNNDSVVVLDKVGVNSDNGTTLKNETKESDTSSSEYEDVSSEEEGEIEEDSVVFVSEINSKDFISINNNKDVNRNNRKTAEVSSNAAKTVQHYSNLLNRNEKRELQEYNSNTYNPNAGKILTSKKRMVIIDGSNVAFKHSADQLFSVKGLTIAIEYFEKKGHEVKAVIPQYRMNQNKSSDPNELLRLHKAGNIVSTPCKNLPGLTSSSYDDRFILQLASELDAAIVSNDNYRDLMHENAAFKKIIETRVIGYTWCNDLFLLPKDPYGKWGPTLDMILYRS